MADLSTFISVTEVYPGQQSQWHDLVDLLKGLSRTDVLFCCARLNHLLTNQSNRTLWQRQEATIRACFDDLGLYKIIDAQLGPDGSPRPVFFRGQMIEMFRWAALVCEDAPNDGSTFESAATRGRFGKAALVASDVWARRVFGGLNAGDGDLNSFRRQAIGPFRKGVEGAMTAPGLEILGRGRIYTELIPSIQPIFTEHFKNHAGLTVEEYQGCCAAMMAQYLREDSDASIFDANRLGETTKNAGVIRGFLRLEGQNVEELRSALWGNANRENVPPSHIRAFDYRPLRERPILRALDGRATLIDPVFMAEKASVGPLFHLIRARPPNEAKKWFGVFGEAFERYAQEVLRRIVPKPPPSLVDPLSFGLEGRDSRSSFEIDACMNYGDDLIIFEMKAAWLREDALGPVSHESLLAILREKYAKTDDGSKGLGQLARVAGAIACGEWIAGGEFREVRRIIPVLLVYDRLIGAPGFGPFAATEFSRMLAPDNGPTKGEMVKGRRRVTSPIVVTIDDLELLEVSSQHFGVRDVLIDYSEAHPDRMLSFHYFLSTSPKYKHRLSASQSLASGAADSLRNGMRIVFGLESW